MKLQGYRHRTSVCPGCGQLINATVDPHQRGPIRTTDITVASCCGTILKFDAFFNLSAMTPAEIEQLPARTAREILEAQAHWRDRQKTRVFVP